MLNGITQFYLSPTRFVPARAEYLEHCIRNELVNVATHLYRPRKDGSLVQAICPGVELNKKSGQTTQATHTGKRNNGKDDQKTAQHATYSRQHANKSDSILTDIQQSQDRGP